MNNTTSSSVSTTDAKALLKDNKINVLVDVRTDGEWKSGHHKNAVHLPSDNIEKLFCDKYPDKETIALLYCRSGNRAGSACGSLRKLGYSNIYYTCATYSDLA